MIMGTGVDLFREATERMERKYRLTSRETELLKSISFYGYNNKQLADAFHITEKTVQNHLANIMRKTRTNSSRELLALLLRMIIEISS